MTGELLERANRLLRAQKYEAALDTYSELTKKHPRIAHCVDFNMRLASARLSGELLSTRGYTQETIIVYTCNFGRYESVKPPVVVEPDIRYILFTDDPSLRSDVWEIRILESETGNPRRESRRAKIQPHVYLPTHDISIYIDSSLELKYHNVRKMVDIAMEGDDAAIYRHYKRDCVYEEIEHVANDNDRSVPKSECKQAIRKYEELGYPRKAGLFENAFIFRRNTPQVQKMNEIWWQEYVAGSERDQFTLMYAIHKSKVKVNSISVGKQFRVNPFVNHYKHKYRNYAHRGSSTRLTVNWIMNQERGRGWAYANSVERISENQLSFKHYTNSDTAKDVSIYLDALIYEDSFKVGRRKILRIGGPRPLWRLHGGDVSQRNAFLQQFDGLIALNEEIYQIAAMSGVATALIPNGIDLQQWRYNYLLRNTRFVVGFTANVTSKQERNIKGYDLVAQACKELGVPLLSLRKGVNQLANNDMQGEFYNKIDCLVHPVLEAKEGSSNTIMEALACGVPVITTTAAGFHGERLSSDTNVLFITRTKPSIKNAILRLMNNPALRLELSKNGRAFCEDNHDIKRIAKQYEGFIHAVIANQSRKLIRFMSLGDPRKMATARIRCQNMVDAINDYYGDKYCATMHSYGEPNVVVVSQLCTHKTLVEIQKLKCRNAQVIYDCADPYYMRDGEVYDVSARDRFWDLVNVSDHVIVPTTELRKSLIDCGVRKPVSVVADSFDYADQMDRSVVESEAPYITWFGNPGNGNLDSALPYLKNFQVSFPDKRVLLITLRKRAYEKFPFDFKEWRYESFVQDLRQSTVVLVSHSHDAPFKSANRFVTAIMNGVPCLYVGRCEEIVELLTSGGYEKYVLSNAEDGVRAVRELQAADERESYVQTMQKILEQKYSWRSVSKRFIDVLNELDVKKTPMSVPILPDTSRRASFVLEP